MSSIVQSLPSFDLKRTLAHVFPGFLLYIGLLLAVDAFMFEEASTFTTLLFKPGSENFDALLSVIGIGLFVGSILGIMIDGIGHWLFEDRWFSGIVKQMELSKDDKIGQAEDDKNISIGQAEELTFGYWKKYLGIADKSPPGGVKKSNPLFPAVSEYLYPFANKKDFDEEKIKLKDQLVPEYYSYFEFYLNSAISLALVGVIIPFYLIIILEIDWFVSSFISSVILLGSMMLFFASLHTLADYRRAIIYSIEGYLRMRKG